MTTKERVLKLTILQRRSSSFTEEEFHAYWTTKHAPLATKWFERNNILGYTQVHPLPLPALLYLIRAVSYPLIHTQPCSNIGFSSRLGPISLRRPCRDLLEKHGGPGESGSGSGVPRQSWP